MKALIEEEIKSGIPAERIMIGKQDLFSLPKIREKTPLASLKARNPIVNW